VLCLYMLSVCVRLCVCVFFFCCFPFTAVARRAKTREWGYQGEMGTWDEEMKSELAVREQQRMHSAAHTPLPCFVAPQQTQKKRGNEGKRGICFRCLAFKTIILSHFAFRRDETTSCSPETSFTVSFLCACMLLPHPQARSCVNSVSPHTEETKKKKLRPRLTASSPHLARAPTVRLQR
jgi:hypothetical protein